MAPLASCRLRTSCWVKTMSPCAPVVTQVLAALLAVAHARVVRCMRPLLSTTPALHEPGEQVDHAGAADADGLGAGDGRDVGGLAVGA